jgi:HEAT repeat protein
MWEASTLFQVLAPSRHHHIPQVPQYPALMDQLSRLEILNFLAILQYPKAEEALKSLLTNELFGVTYAASNTLLEEGGEEALNILRHLLQEEDEKIRVQAAMVLALSGSEPEAIDALQEAYFVMDREMKINILGAIGHIGDRKSIPFLLDLLDESHQILKVVTASALIQCLYH